MAPEPSATEILTEGRSILDPILEPAGFAFRFDGEGRSSGGDFASATYARGNRRLELHYRYSLGLVRYHLDGESISHDDFMRIALAGRGGNQYPGFSEEPADAFRHLAHDLERFAGAFLSGTDEEFRSVIEEANRNPKPTGFRALSDRRTSGDEK